MGVFGPMQLILLFITVLMIVFPIIAMWKLYEKANKPGWAAVVPIYNLIVFMQIIGKPWWWILLWCIPYINVIWIIWGWNLMVKRFGKSEGFTVGVILLGIIFIPILAFGNSKYIGN